MPSLYSSIQSGSQCSSLSVNQPSNIGSSFAGAHSFRAISRAVSSKAGWKTSGKSPWSQALARPSGLWRATNCEPMLSVAE
jgi:hypothetical protein